MFKLRKKKEVPKERSPKEIADEITSKIKFGSPGGPQYDSIQDMMREWVAQGKLVYPRTEEDLPLFREQLEAMKKEAMGNLNSAKAMCDALMASHAALEKSDSDAPEKD